MILTLKETFTVGTDSYFASASPNDQYEVVFEDDLNTGYFYAIICGAENQIVDALHIYNVESIVDKDVPSVCEILWSDDGNLSLLLINDYCHAIFDFANRAGYCRNGFPESNSDWTIIKERVLTEDIITRLLQ